MKAPILSLSILASLLSSCMNQPSAPISYGSQSTSASSAGNSSYSSDDIVEQPIIKETTNWGEKTLDEKYTSENVSNELGTIPTAPEAPPLRTETISHEVIEGETIDSIAKQYGIERDALIKANKLKAPYHLEELQILKIPPQLDPSQLADSDTSLESVSVGDVISPNSTNRAPAIQHHAPQHAPKLSLALPVAGSVISRFGADHAGIKNNGINIEAPLGEEVHSLSTGIVVYSGNDPKFGNLIIVKSENDEIFMAYSHMSDLILKKADHISNGQTIGHIGQTGNVTSPQLHFAVRRGKIPIDPEKYLSDTTSGN